MKERKIYKNLIFVLAIMIFMMPQKIFAAEVNNSVYKLVDVVTLNNAGNSRATEESWGYGNLYGENTLFSKPTAYAVTTVKNGSAYKVSAQISVTNSDNTVDSLVKTENKNAVSATSGTIVSKTSSCKFEGYHRIQMNQGGGWQSAETSKSY